MHVILILASYAAAVAAGCVVYCGITGPPGGRAERALAIAAALASAVTVLGTVRGWVG